MGIYTSIQVKSFGFAGDDIIPAVSHDGKIVLSENETINESFLVNNIKIMGLTSNGWIADFGIEPMPESNSWKINFTNKRVLFISDYIPSFFSGKGVKKNGKISVGQIKLTDIIKISQKTGNDVIPFIVEISYKRNDGAKLLICIETDIQTQKLICNHVKVIIKANEDAGNNIIVR